MGGGSGTALHCRLFGLLGSQGIRLYLCGRDDDAVRLIFCRVVYETYCLIERLIVDLLLSIVLRLSSLWRSLHEIIARATRSDVILWHHDDYSMQ